MKGGILWKIRSLYFGYIKHFVTNMNQNLYQMLPKSLFSDWLRPQAMRNKS